MANGCSNRPMRNLASNTRRTVRSNSSVSAARLDILEFFSISGRFRHLYVHPCFHGKKPCFSDSLPDPLDLVGIVNAAVVADTQTVNPIFL